MGQLGAKMGQLGAQIGPIGQLRAPMGHLGVVPVLNPLFLGIAANLEESVKIGVWVSFRMLNPKFNGALQKKIFLLHTAAYLLHTS